LNELKRASASYMKFKIDVRLKRYERALAHLAEADEAVLQEHADEAFQLIQGLRLFSPARRAFSKATSFHQVWFLLLHSIG